MTDSSPSLSPLGPVSEHAERALLARIRQHKSVFWLDASSAFVGLVDALAARKDAGAFPFPVVAFRGSFLETMLALRGVGGGREKPSMVVHLPGFRATGVRETPLLELYEPGHPFEPALETLVREAATGHAPPEAIEAYVKSPGLTLEGADRWLAQQRAGRAAEPSELGTWLDATSLGVVVEELLGRDTCLRAKLGVPADVGILAAHLHRHTGLDEAFRAVCQRSTMGEVDQLAFALAAWLLGVEFVGDLSRPPRMPALAPLAALSRPLRETCAGLIQALRARHPDRYAAWADDIERTVIAPELAELRPEELGQIDTFRREERSVLQAAIESLEQGAFAAAADWARAREGSASFWLERDKLQRWEWQLVGHAAALGLSLAARPRPFASLGSLDEAVETYKRSAFEVDRAHRRFEQARLQLLDLRQEHFIELRDDVTRALRERYRAWADQLARDFSALCREHGVLPGKALQQRHVFEDVVLPLTLGGERVVVFLVDAFRFEMAAELLADLGGGGASVTLDARLAELPTLTAVGMNVLAPVQHAGRLQVLVDQGAFRGFQRGEFKVNDPKSRARAMGERAVGSAATQMQLDEVCNEEPGTLRKRVTASKKLIVVHSTEIDDAGEANLGLQTFDNTLRDLRNAFTHLQAAGVKQFVFTADHGFLLQDSTTAVHPWGTKRDPERRHIYSRQERQEPDKLTVSLQKLGYDGDPGFLLFREDTGVFATAQSGGSFVHGGNSPQERVIPVLTITRKREASPSFAAYRVQARASADLNGARVVELSLDFERMQNTTLDFVAGSDIELALRAAGPGEVALSLRDASDGASLQGGRLFVTVGAKSARVFFVLRGRQKEPVAIEVYGPDGGRSVTPATTAAAFAVDRDLSVAPPPPEPPAADARWQDSLGDAAAVAIFERIEKTGSISEQDVGALLGGARGARKFSLAFEGYLQKLPFRVRIETAQGKVYVKDGDK